MKVAVVIHTVIAGDTLWALSRTYKTTTDIILDDNDFITNPNSIRVGWQLKIRTPQEVAEEQMASASSELSESSVLESDTRSESLPPATKEKKSKVMWDTAEVVEKQTGRVRILKTIPLVERLENNTFREINWLHPPSMWRTFQRITGEWWTYLDGPDVYITALYNLGGNQWVYDLPGYVEFEDFPAPVKKQLDQVEILSAAPPLKPPEIENYKPKTPFFNPRGHERPVLQIKKDNRIITIELRVLGAGGGYTHEIQSNRTNGGWFLNLAGSNLSVKTITGFFLDTETNHEFDDFMSNYNRYLTAYKEGNFYSSAICTFFYKGREYKGLIAAFNYSDQESEPLLRRFTMQFLVLKEKGPNEGAATPPNVEQVVDEDDGDFYSDIRYLLINPLTGLYGTEVVEGGE